MTVLAVSASGLLGGAERVLLEWIAAIEGSVVLAVPPGPLADAATAAGLETAALSGRPLQRRGRTGAAARDLGALAAELGRLVRRHRPALLVASGERAVLAAATALPRSPRTLALLHDLPRSAAAAALLRAASARADVVVATSGAIARAADPGARRLARTCVIHPGVDLSAGALRRAVAGTAARALPGGARTVEARRSRARDRRARAGPAARHRGGAPAGRPAGLRGIHDRARQPDLAGRVRLLGAVDEPRDLLAGAHCLLHCADREPFGRALVEALAAGRPVVAPSAAGPLKIVTPACGRLYGPGSADAGAIALRAVLAAPELRAGARARAEAFDGGGGAALRRRGRARCRLSLYGRAPWAPAGCDRGR